MLKLRHNLQERGIFGYYYDKTIKRVIYILK